MSDELITAHHGGSRVEKKNQVSSLPGEDAHNESVALARFCCAQMVKVS